MQNDTLILAQLRRFLLLLVIGLCVGTIVELWLMEHYESPAQIMPFVLCGVGLLASLAALVRPQRPVLMGLRASMAVLMAGCLFGIYEHFENNLELALELKPNAAMATLLIETLRGASPMLAPGILALAAILAVAATYRHPGLRQQS